MRCAHIWFNEITERSEHTPSHFVSRISFSLPPPYLINSDAMLNLTNLTLRRGPKVLLQGAELTVHRGQKIGITGGNGTGKSTLLALVRGELEPDAGEFTLPPALVIAHVAQETPATPTPALEYVLAGDEELAGIRAELATAERDADGVRQAVLHARLEAIGGYSAEARAARLMHGLGFSSSELSQPVSAFSGGWRMRLNLARALMCRSDLLLLDEPTNHLDLDAVFWLEEWLRGYPGTLLLISHDREFLDRVVEGIVHLERQSLTLYPGNYSQFEVRRAERLAQQQAAHEKQEREVAHIRRFVERFRAKATKARQAQSRLKQLARMELIAPAHVDSPFHFEFRPPEKLPDPLLTLERVSGGYSEAAVFNGAGLSLRAGSRLGLVGPNGAGKSTLIKILAQELAPLAGQSFRAPDLKVGYFAQHQLEQLDPEASALLHMRRLDPLAPEQALRDFLGGFGFCGDEALRPVAPFSGGEKARLVLALVVYQRPNLLLLDEPTNHLDLDMRHALTLALQDYEGALVLVSHDRHLLASVTDELLLVAEGKVLPFDGDLEDYRRWLAERRSREEEGGAAEPVAHGAAARKEKKRLEAERRQRLQPLRKALEKLEKEMDGLNRDKAAVEQRLADPGIYEAAGKDELRQLLLDQARIDQALAIAEERWLELGEELEAAS